MKGAFKIIAVIFGLFSFFYSSAQSDSVPIKFRTLELNDDRIISLQSFADAGSLNIGENCIKANGDVYNHSTAIPFLFTKTILQNGFIDDDLKNKASNHLKKFNYQEFGYDVGLSWYHHWTDVSFLGNCVTSVSLRQRDINQLRFTKDAFNVVFFGNAMYAGDSARLDGSKYLGINFRQLQFGWLKKFGKADSSWSLYVGASLLQGINANAVNVGKGNLFTEMNGEYLDLNSSFLYWKTDTGVVTPFTFTGVGASADIVLSFDIGKKGNFRFALNDVGFISWNKESQRYVQDSTIHFEGVEVKNLFAFQDSSFLNINTDSILKLTGVKTVKKKFSTSLPMVVSMVYSQNVMHNQGVLRIGLQYKPSFNVVPMLFISFSSYKPKFIYPTLMVNVGGVEGFNAGATLSKAIANKLFISVGSESLLGFIFQDTFSSASAFARVSMRF